MGITIDFHMDISGIEKKFTEQGLSNARMLLCERIQQHCEPLVPKDTGALRMSRSTGSDYKEIKWDTEYAQYVYNFGDVHFTTPGTCGHWFEVAKQEHLGDWQQVVREALVS